MECLYKEPDDNYSNSDTDENEESEDEAYSSYDNISSGQGMVLESSNYLNLDVNTDNQDEGEDEAEGEGESNGEGIHIYHQLITLLLRFR